jgi:hypothetical protein
MRYAGMATAGGAMAVMPLQFPGNMNHQQFNFSPPAQAGQAYRGGQITFSPVIHINGASADAGQIRAQVDQGMKAAYTEFEANMKRWEANKSRTGFKP